MSYPVLYISGRMSGVPEHNYPAFHMAAYLLRRQGYTVVSPAELSGGDTTQPWEHYLRRDLKAMLDCDAVCLLSDWQESRGAQLELHVAERVGMRCRSLEWWLEAGVGA